MLAANVPDDSFVFQRDNELAHWACYTVKLLQYKTPSFVSSELWPPTADR